MCLNNDEEDTIVGNFTSKGIDTLQVEEVMPILLITPMATRQKQLLGVFLNIFAQKYKEKRTW